MGLIVLFSILWQRHWHPVSGETHLYFIGIFFIECRYLKGFAWVLHAAGWWLCMSSPTRAWFIDINYLQMHAKHFVNTSTVWKGLSYVAISAITRRVCFQEPFLHARVKAATAHRPFSLSAAVTIPQPKDSALVMNHSNQLITVASSSQKPKNSNTTQFKCSTTCYREHPELRWR